MAQIILPNGSAPASPASGTVTVYSKTSDKRLYYKDDTGTEIGPLATAVTGAITGSGLTMATARILGRTTASTGAIEEITVGSGLTLSAGNLSASASASSPISQIQMFDNFGGL